MSSQWNSRRNRAHRFLQERRKLKQEGVNKIVDLTARTELSPSSPSFPNQQPEHHAPITTAETALHPEDSPVTPDRGLSLKTPISPASTVSRSHEALSPLTYPRSPPIPESVPISSPPSKREIFPTSPQQQALQHQAYPRSPPILESVPVGPPVSATGICPTPQKPQREEDLFESPSASSRQSNSSNSTGSGRPKKNLQDKARAYRARARQKKRDVINFGTVTPPRHLVPPHVMSSEKKLIVLISSGVSDRMQQTNQQRAFTVLAARKTPHEKIDGMDPAMKETRNELFGVSGIRGNYPQFFFKDKEGTTTFIGGWSEIEALNEVSLISAEVQAANPDIQTWESFFSGCVESFT